MLNEEDRLRLGEQMELARLSLKSSSQEVLKLSVALTVEGCATHVAPMRAAHGSIQDALRSLETGTINAGAELAKKLADSIPGYPEQEVTR